MDSNIHKFKEELKELVKKGQLLMYRMALDLKITSAKTDEEEHLKLKTSIFQGRI